MSATWARVSVFTPTIFWSVSVMPTGTRPPEVGYL
jgi:hypothetical protein